MTAILAVDAYGAAPSQYADTILLRVTLSFNYGGVCVQARFSTRPAGRAAMKKRGAEIDPAPYRVEYGEN